MTEQSVENRLEHTTSDISNETGEPSHRDVVTIVLTADNHLGYAALSQQHQKREELQQRLRLAFQQVTNFAIERSVDLFIQAGDLFDTKPPAERDRSFVVELLAQLKQAGIHTFILGGAHDTLVEIAPLQSKSTPAPQIDDSRPGTLHYLPPVSADAAILEPVILDIRGMRMGIYGLGMLAEQDGDSLARVRLQAQADEIDLPILVLHAPIEGLTSGSSLLDTRSQVSRASILNQSVIRYILAGYHHDYSRSRIGQTEIIVAGSTQLTSFSSSDQEPGFVYIGLAADGVRWCNRIGVDSLKLQRLVLHTQDLWPVASEDSEASTATEQAAPEVPRAIKNPTEIIIESLQPLCSPGTMVQLRLEGKLTSQHYHELDLNTIRRYGEEHCFALAIDDSALSLLPEQEVISLEAGERFSPRKELIALADEWIAAANDEQEKRALQATKEELLLAMDEGRKV